MSVETLNDLFFFYIYTTGFFPLFFSCSLLKYINNMAKPINAREAFELHKSAVTRDFIAKPRLGNILWEIKHIDFLLKRNFFSKRLSYCYRC
jgi:hypothetical protein